MAGFSVPEATLLVVSPYDKGSLPAIEKAICRARTWASTPRTTER